MAKTQTPFFGLGAQGSVGGSITAQKRSGSTMLREKPLPTDPYSLAQAYQRWLYEDYAYLWRQQSEATRRAYAADGVRFHLTGFQYWMKYQLTNLPDFMAWWKFDSVTGATTPDSSRNDNPATLLGPSPGDGLIAGSAYFDGLNDRMSVPTAPSLKSIEVTYMAFIYPISIPSAVASMILENGSPNDRFYIIPSGAGYRLVSDLTSAGGGNCPPDLNFSEWHHVAVQISVVGAVKRERWYIDGTLRRVTNRDANTRAPGLGNINIGFTGPNRWFDGYIDDLIAVNRALDEAEILRHSLRRYAL